MKERATRRRGWRVGELAGATGLTVRTLHHYEHVGLLTPGSRTEGRQRLYDERDVRRLYRIRALRDLGLSLEEIRPILAADRGRLIDVLREHRARVDAEIARLKRLRALLDHLESDRAADADTMLATIEAMSRVVRRGEERANEGRGADAAARWAKVGAALRACMQRGEEPSSPRARAVGRKAMALLVEFAGGDRAMLHALAHLRRHCPPKDFAGWNAAMMRYLDRALANLQGPEDDGC